jgi:antitoxin (DNA-binding transcriptional repressor) of toxin-antitoxin stability system
MKTISVQKMRFEFGEVRHALEQGEELVLTFRNRPLARLLPFAIKSAGGEDPALSFGMRDVDVQVISNAEMDEAIYG